MYDKILVAIDFSPSSKQVFTKALSIAKADGGNLILLHILSREEEGSPGMSSYFVDRKDRCIHVHPKIMHQAKEIYEREWELFKQKGLEILRFYAKKARSAGVKTEFAQINGHPSLAICDFARSRHVDLIAMGRRGHSGLQEMLMGSVSNYVVHHAPCSILLVQTPILEESASENEIEKIAYA